MSVTMRPLGSSFGVCVTWVWGLGWILGGWGVRGGGGVRVKIILCPDRFSPPSHLGEFYWVDGLGRWALEFFILFVCFFYNP